MRPAIGSYGLRIEVASTSELMGRRAAEIIVAELKRKPDLLLCVSAGGTPTGMYRGLVERASRHPKLFKKLRVIQIDEWAGIAPADPATCESDVRAKLVTPLQIGPDRFAGFKSDVIDRKSECLRISKWLSAEGPIDICILGLGRNGHVAMNEPADSLLPNTHVAKLARSSRHHGMLKNLPRKPQYGLTLGMGDILRSKKILLLVSGRQKRAPLKRLIDPQVTTRFPASLLWLHSDARILCDKEAAPKL
jgi:galactosamine-6-phosphate isomerase